jgi:hypothetical protein
MYMDRQFDDFDIGPQCEEFYTEEEYYQYCIDEQGWRKGW